MSTGSLQIYFRKEVLGAEALANHQLFESRFSANDETEPTIWREAMGGVECRGGVVAMLWLLVSAAAAQRGHSGGNAIEPQGHPIEKDFIGYTINNTLRQDGLDWCELLFGQRDAAKSLIKGPPAIKRQVQLNSDTLHPRAIHVFVDDSGAASQSGSVEVNDKGQLSAIADALKALWTRLHEEHVVDEAPCCPLASLRPDDKNLANQLKLAARWLRYDVGDLHPRSGALLGQIKRVDLLQTLEPVFRNYADRIRSIAAEARTPQAQNLAITAKSLSELYQQFWALVEPIIEMVEGNWMQLLGELRRVDREFHGVLTQLRLPRAAASSILVEPDDQQLVVPEAAVEGLRRLRHGFATSIDLLIEMKADEQGALAPLLNNSPM